MPTDTTSFVWSLASCPVFGFSLTSQWSEPSCVVNLKGAVLGLENLECEYALQYCVRQLATPFSMQLTRFRMISDFFYPQPGLDYRKQHCTLHLD